MGFKLTVIVMRYSYLAGIQLMYKHVCDMNNGLVN